MEGINLIGKWFNQHMQTLIYILGVILTLITIFLIIKQVKIAKRQTEMAELKATLPPDFKFTRMHSSDGLHIVYDITGRSEIPIKLQKITIKTWDKNNPQRKYADIEKPLDVELDRDKTIHDELLCPRDLFETNESKNDEHLRGYHLFGNIAAELCLYYLDFNKDIKKECKKIDRLMPW